MDLGAMLGQYGPGIFIVAVIAGIVWYIAKGDGGGGDNRGYKSNGNEGGNSNRSTGSSNSNNTNME